MYVSEKNSRSKLKTHPFSWPFTVRIKWSSDQSKVISSHSGFNKRVVTKWSHSAVVRLWLNSGRTAVMTQWYDNGHYQMSNRHKSVRIVFFCAAYGTESLSVLFSLGFYKKRQKYWTLSKEFWGLLLHPKENMSKNIINALLFLYYWKRSRTDDWEENLTNMFHYSGNYLPRNTEWSVNPCRVACPIYFFANFIFWWT